MDNLLHLAHPDGALLVAYAVDISILTEDQSKQEIERGIVSSVTVIGVVLDASHSFAQHAVAISKTASKRFDKSSRMSTSS
ncbi:hypothetical protein EVAR_92094_1 [Eumeta japonica]|uniref:Uncharacterized protein n=1 Tax=Eumeta variegata TaxID=151549 RepID=A0A4C1T169_EUMVA|nr:hypothetical protein EVAR_92094_1 [Eumeta japonica]